MPVGTTLVNLRAMLKAEIGDEMSESITTANDARYNRLLANQQIWLVGKDAWLLPGKVQKEVALTAGTRLYSLPAGIDLQQLDAPAYVKFGNIRFVIEHGISQDNYNAMDPALNMRSNPIFRWDIVDDSGTRKLEVWPTPASDQTLIFEGKPTLGALASDSDTCVVDDLLLVLFTAAEILARQKQGDAQAKLAKANDRLNWLKGNRPSEFETFSMRGAGQKPSCARTMVGATDYSLRYIRYVEGVGTQMLADDGLWHTFQIVIDQGQATIEVDPQGTL